MVDPRRSSMQLTRDEILAQLTEHQETLRRMSVRRLGLFGSVARGENAAASDLDFLVEFERKSFDGYMDLKMFLEELFSCRVDLVLADAIKPRLRERIHAETIHAPGF
jgi:predicted nucleotidyltransferase